MSHDADIPYARELLRVMNKGSNGVLVVSYDGKSRRVFLRGGRVAFAATTLDTERIGRLLVRSGDLEDKDVSEALAGAQAEGVMIGEWLVNNGRLTEQKLLWGLRQQTERIACSSFAWPAADLEFQPSGEEPLGFQNFELPMINIMLEGSRRFMPPALAIDVLNGIGERAVLGKAFHDVLRDVRLGPEEQRVISLLDGKRTPEEIARLTLIDADEVYKIAAGFVLIGAVKVSARATLGEQTMENAAKQFEDMTPVEVVPPITLAGDALPPPETVLVLDDDKATPAWRDELDTATESLLVWFDGQRTCGDILEMLEGDNEAVQTLARLVSGGYLVAGGTVQVEAQPEPTPEPQKIPAVNVSRGGNSHNTPTNATQTPMINMGDPPPADASLADALLQQADRLVEAGARAVDAGNFQHAARFFQRALRKSPDHPDALLGLGTSRFGMNDRSGARIAWESFLRVEPNTDLSERIRKVLSTL